MFSSRATSHHSQENVIRPHFSLINGSRFTIKVTIAVKERYESPLTATQASDARDAVVKAIYGRLFNWIVGVINANIKNDTTRRVAADIGVLDVFGFECFAYNSLEQLCINYTNETLQQQFNKFVFELEQQEYKDEGIRWQFIQFPSNQDVLNLIEEKKVGFLAMLDDECFLPKGSDSNLAGRVHSAFNGHPRYVCSSSQRSKNEFGIVHYAGLVVYNMASFMVNRQGICFC